MFPKIQQKAKFTGIPFTDIAAKFPQVTTIFCVFRLLKIQLSGRWPTTFHDFWKTLSGESTKFLLQYYRISIFVEITKS